MEYGHGGDIYTYKGMLDFSVNVNPFGPSEAVLEAAKRGIDKCCAYPDSQCRALRTALAAKLGVPQEYILPGNGAADLFFSLVTAERPKKALIPVPAFSEYERALLTVDCQIRYHPTEEKENFRLTERFLEELTEDLDLVFLCSPSNPAGQVIPEDLLRRIIRRCGEKKIRLMLDECFIEFTDRENAFQAEREAENCPQLFVVRAFTKMHAIPGLRLGYGITSDTELLERMMNGESVPSLPVRVTPSAIVSRHSTDAFTVSNPKLAMAVEFLCGNYMNFISVVDAAHEAGISASMLNRKFRRYLGISPQRFLLELRLNRIRELLDNTELSLSKIAKQTGYGSSMALSSAFKRETGMTPGTYRQSRRSDIHERLFVGRQTPHTRRSGVPRYRGGGHSPA